MFGSGKGGPGMPMIPPELAGLMGSTFGGDLSAYGMMGMSQLEMNRRVEDQMSAMLNMRAYGLPDLPRGVPSPPPKLEPEVLDCAYCGNPRDDGKKKCPGCGAREKKQRNDKPGRGGRRGNR